VQEFSSELFHPFTIKLLAKHETTLYRWKHWNEDQDEDINGEAGSKIKALTVPPIADWHSKY
jgi:hypothetical protein